MEFPSEIRVVSLLVTNGVSHEVDVSVVSIIHLLIVVQQEAMTFQTEKNIQSTEGLKRKRLGKRAERFKPSPIINKRGFIFTPA